MGYLLSIVVPTKDRYYYLKHLVELIKGFKSDEIEVVIQDNTANNFEILEYINKLDYPHLKYFYTKEQIPIYQNCDNAILNSTGEYVCFIGDDDGVTKHIIECTKWMKRNNVEVVMPAKVFYSWPDSSGNYKKGLNLAGIVKHKRFSGRIEKRNSDEVLSERIKHGFVSRGELPLLYHGIVKRTTLDRIYTKCGSFFPGPSPDIANGVALALVTESFYSVDYPIAFSGASKHHGGGIKKMKNRANDIDNIPFLPPNAKRDWEKKIPLIWTGETVWCESAVKALRKMGRDDLVSNVNYEYLYAWFSSFHYPLRDMAYKLSNNKMKLFINSNIGVIKRYFNAFYRMMRLRLNINSETIIHSGCQNITEAVTYLESFPCSFDENLK